MNASSALGIESPYTRARGPRFHKPARKDYDRANRKCLACTFSQYISKPTNFCRHLTYDICATCSAIDLEEKKVATKRRIKG
jgi:hypothetical protein